MRIDDLETGVFPGEGDDRTGELKGVHVDEGVFLQAEVCEEVSVSPEILSCLLVCLGLWGSCHIAAVRPIAQNDLIA